MTGRTGGHESRQTCDAVLTALMTERERIAGELADLVVHRLFSAGLQLQSARGLVRDDPDEASLRLGRAVDELDGALRDLRTTIYRLPGAPRPRAAGDRQDTVAAGCRAPAGSTRTEPPGPP